MAEQETAEGCGSCGRERGDAPQLTTIEWCHASWDLLRVVIMKYIWGICL